MDREELAAQLYANNYVKHSQREIFTSHLTPKQSFKAADHFLAEAKKQSAKDGDGKSWPEPPKPKREAREIWFRAKDCKTMYVNVAGLPISPQGEGWTKYREVLDD